jgi:serine/threonine-protein kinase
MLAGRVPFEGNAKVAMVKHLTEEAPSLRTLDPSLSDGIVAVVERLMRKNPADRYATPRDLTAALELLERGGPAEPGASLGGSAPGGDAAPRKRRRRRR